MAGEEGAAWKPLRGPKLSRESARLTAHGRGSTTGSAVGLCENPDGYCSVIDFHNRVPLVTLVVAVVECFRRVEILWKARHGSSWLTRSLGMINIPFLSTLPPSSPSA